MRAQTNMPAMVTRVRFTGTIAVPPGAIFETAGDEVRAKYIFGPIGFNRSNHVGRFCLNGFNKPMNVNFPNGLCKSKVNLNSIKIVIM